MTQVASWNVNSLKVRLPQLLEWLAANPVDVIGLQETKLEDANFPAAALQAAGYHVAYSGQKTYNGVALLSRQPLTDVSLLLDAEDPQRRFVAATCGGVRYINVYVPNGQALDSDKYVYKLRWLQQLQQRLQAELAAHPQLVIMGDFNIAPDDRDVHDPAAWQGQILCSEPERSALQGLLALGLHDSYRLFEQAPASFSWWDYRQGGFRRNHGLRIDLILISEALRARCSAADIDREPRLHERPSDHTPVLAQWPDAGL